MRCRETEEKKELRAIEAIYRYCSLLLRLIDALYARNTICSSDRKVVVVVLDAEGTVMRLELNGQCTSERDSQI